VSEKLSNNHKPPTHPDMADGKIGVLLVNLGTPDGTGYWPMRRYLKEFLSDHRVIEANRAVWWFVLNFIILSKRPQKSGEAYKCIWNRELDESPLRTITRSQSEKLAVRLKSGHGEVIVDWAMRYGTPSIEQKLMEMQKNGCERILLFPLYPQYAAATTATVNDKAFDVLKKMRWQPALRTVPAYHDDPVYIDALVTSMKNSIAALDFEPEIVLASFHGLPKSYFEKGDPYHCHCAKTVRLMRERSGMSDDHLQLTFQSRLGKKEWLQPYTDKTIEKLAQEGVKNIAVIMPGFVADCVETLEEIAIEAQEIFLKSGGKNFAALACLNDSGEGIDVLEAVVMRELQGWI